MERSERVKARNEAESRSVKRWESVAEWAGFVEKGGMVGEIATIGLILFNLAVVAWLLFGGGWATHSAEEIAEDGRALVYSVFYAGIAEVVRFVAGIVKHKAKQEAQRHARRILKTWGA